MRILVTGSSGGIGSAIVLEFLNNGHIVYGIDKEKSVFNSPNYYHYLCDITKDKLPDLDNIEILIGCAGTQTGTMSDIDANLVAAINVCEKYGRNNPNIKSVLNIASASGTTGSEFPAYAASKGGLITYTKNLALGLAPRAVANTLSPGGVITRSNKHILENDELYQKVLDEAIMHKWATEKEIAEFAYFMTVINKSMTGQDVLVDNGEALKSNFIW